MVINSRFGPTAARYQLDLTADWTLKRLHVQVIGGPQLSVHVDDQGRWYDASGVEITSLRGCTDVDISATPFTNSLPIRRLRLARNERRLIRVAYLRLPDLSLVAVDQAYTCLEPDRLYRYEALFRDFSAELPVDEHGLVRDYPSLFRRCPVGFQYPD